MHEIDKNRFGIFIQTLRKEQGLTQAQLAERLYVSDKAVSKWERGLSLPDVSLLIPLAETFNVTVTELLEARRIEPATPIAPAQVEALVQRALTLTEQRGQRVTHHRARNALIYGLSLLVALAEIALLLHLGYSPLELSDTVFLTVGLCGGFGAYFWLLTKERLPALYDQHHITGYMDGPVRMNLPGLRVSNRNWLPIVKALRISLTAVMVGYPLLYLLATRLAPQANARLLLLLTLSVTLGGLFLPVYIVGKRHE